LSEIIEVKQSEKKNILTILLVVVFAIIAYEVWKYIQSQGGLANVLGLGSASGGGFGGIGAGSQIGNGSSITTDNVGGSPNISPANGITGVTGNNTGVTGNNTTSYNPTPVQAGQLAIISATAMNNPNTNISPTGQLANQINLLQNHSAAIVSSLHQNGLTTGQANQAYQNVFNQAKSNFLQQSRE
jgi:hypothetical protein